MPPATKWGLICPADSVRLEPPGRAMGKQPAHPWRPKTLLELLNHFKEPFFAAALPASHTPSSRRPDLPDLRDVKGQDQAKRALGEIAAAGEDTTWPSSARLARANPCSPSACLASCPI